MQTGETNSSSETTSRVRRLSNSSFEIDSPAVRERLPSVDTDAFQPPAVRERLSFGNRFSPSSGDGNRPFARIRDRFQSDSESLPSSDGSIREQLPRPTLPSPTLPQPQVRSRLSAPRVRERLPATDVSAQLPRPQIRPQLSASEVRDRLAETDFKPSLPDTEEYLLEREGIDRDTHESRTTKPEYFVGVIPDPHETVADALSADSDFGPSYMTYPKFLTDEEFDIRVEADSIWVYRSWSFAHFQLHVPLFTLPDENGVYVFYHHEYNWIRHPSIHKEADYLNPEWGRDRVVELFTDAGLEMQTGEQIDSSAYPMAAAYAQEVYA